MEQKIPDISDRDIKRIIKRDFPQFGFDEIEKRLKIYKSESKKGRNRIYASILKLSNGNVDLITKYAQKANLDFRIVIALSEYPKYSEYSFEDELSSEVKKQLINDDWEQYKNWLEKI